MTAAAVAPLDRLDDAALVSSALKGSPEAFGVLVARYRVPILGLAYRFTRSREEADDVAQTALLQAYRHLPSFRRDRSFSRWLFMIARNASVDAVRRRRRDRELLVATPEGAPDPSDVVVHLDEAVRVRAAVKALPGPLRAPLELHYLGGLKYREIAQTLEIPLGTVKTNISRGRRRLRAQMMASGAAGSRGEASRLGGRKERCPLPSLSIV